VEMEDTKAISIPKLAALERAKALGLEINRYEISAVEHQAREWKKHEQAEKLEVPPAGGQDPNDTRYMIQNLHPVESSEGGPQSGIPQGRSRTQNPESSINEAFDWQPQQPDQSEPENKFKNLNTASIARLARKIMAREWAMALGGSRGLESEQATIERGAEKYRKKEALEKEMKEIEGQRANKQRIALEEVLWIFGRNLLKVPKPITPEAAEALLEEALSEVGDTIRITWHVDGCHILLEPWEDKRLRRKTGEPLPAVFQATIDHNLMFTSYQKIEDPQLLQQTQNDLILKNILSSFRKSPRKDFHDFENAVSEGGRIIRSTKMDGGGKINFEPWEEMRRRNIERKGHPPIMTYVINADKDFEHITCGQ